MIYLAEVTMLVAAVVFGLAGIFILALFAWTEATKYFAALRATRRFRVHQQRFAIWRTSSGTPDRTQER
jgi:hypothetical protein